MFPKCRAHGIVGQALAQTSSAQGLAWCKHSSQFFQPIWQSLQWTNTTHLIGFRHKPQLSFLFPWQPWAANSSEITSGSNNATALYTWWKTNTHFPAHKEHDAPASSHDGYGPHMDRRTRFQTLWKERLDKGNAWWREKLLLCFIKQLGYTRTLRAVSLHAVSLQCSVGISWLCATGFRSK